MTNTPDFLPDYSSMPFNGRYRPLFKLLSTDNWRFVRKDGMPIECDTASQAIEAAKDCVRHILNPEIRAEQADKVADVLGVEQWRRERAAQAAGDQEAVLGAVIVKGRQVKIERVRRARA
ncbi:hypothetical protein [Mesorhizobium amorphae]|uniref:hypothetical protein n=1 Tax=Mesorhizobium amorphae TaxID=71433 RepID=UPI0011826EF7|nr:hypothetical protein [Mesorhizobium amorphae]